MPPYLQIHLDHLIWSLVGGVTFTVLVSLAVVGRRWTFSWMRRSPEGTREHGFGGAVREGYKPVPVFVVVMVGLFLVWAVLYSLYTVSRFSH